MDIAEILNKQLGTGFIAEDSSFIATFPAYLSKTYQYQIIRMFGVEFCVLSIQKVDFQLAIYQKHLESVKATLSMPVALYFPTLTSYQKKVLIQHTIPFISGKSQVFLPFLGVTLSEQAAHQKIVRKSLTAMAQYLFLFLYYKKAEDSFIQADLGKILGINNMNISRGIRELCDCGLMQATSEAVTNRIAFVSSRQHVLSMALPLMGSPIQKIIEVTDEKIPKNTVIAGEEALARRTMMADGEQKVRAIYRLAYKQKEKSNVEMYSDTNKVSLELWKYQPETLTGDGIADPISLYLCYRDTQDERIQKEIKRILDELGVKINEGNSSY